MWMCAENWNELTRGKRVLRGAKWGSAGKEVSIASPVNRTPVSMPLYIHMRIDDYFESRFGLRFRSRSLFATGSPMIAKQYGEIRSLIATRDFCFCWSPHATDLYEEVALNRGSNESIEDMLARLSYRCDDLAGAIESGNEIMLVGAAFVAHRWSADDAQRT